MRPPKGNGRARVAPPAGKGKKAPKQPAPVDLDRERRVRGALDELAALLEGGALNEDRTRAYLAGELEAAPMDSDEVPTSIRLPRRILAIADDLAARRAARLGERASRSAVLRLAIERGIAVLEREAAELDAPSTPAALRADLDALRARVEVMEDERARAGELACARSDFEEMLRREAAGYPLGERLQSLRDAIDRGWPPPRGRASNPAG